MNITPNMLLPYPSPSSAPCEFDEQWCQFTAAVDAVLDRFQLGVDRTWPAVPAAILHVKTTTAAPFLPLNSNPIAFTDVLIDTAGMTDLDADPYGITVPLTGRWTVALFMTQNTSNNINAQSIISASSGVTHSILDRGPGVFYHNTVNQPVVSLTAGTRVTMSSFVSPVTPRSATEACLAVIWHSDTERPS